MNFKKIHHIAIICSDYTKSKDFYVNKLGFDIKQEIYREERDSYKLDLALNGEYIIELFSFPEAPARPSYPEAQGLRHLAFEVEDIEGAVEALNQKGIKTEEIRIDPYTDKKFTFFEDPDGLPLELYEI
ncbi:SMU1112c/YaeR family gloxylase I-like metalloprotein [Rossellomorea vietnamensis]|uniref:SMU1112c/YaeR family gloxylase I-like metalloprotein n=1 Tax=Rossellomorea vietnamensis TaxID=218284 RepID=UPI001E6270D7|nr:VOC family protein [Rossellomorea vietnamensis]MCC5802168.1 VOC family protein [Rossellomorea vietnamensis]